MPLEDLDIEIDQQLHDKLLIMMLCKNVYKRQVLYFTNDFLHTSSCYKTRSINFHPLTLFYMHASLPPLFYS